MIDLVVNGATLFLVHSPRLLLCRFSVHPYGEFVTDNFGSIPDMLPGDYANTFVFSDKNCLNNTFSRGCRFDPIQRVRSG